MDALELVDHLGQVQPQAGEEFAFVVGEQREFFKRPSGSDLGIDDVSRLRKFLKAAGAEPFEAGRAISSETIVVIDHHLARVFQETNGSSPQAELPIKPYDPHHFNGGESDPNIGEPISRSSVR